MSVIALPASPRYNAGSPFLLSQAADLESPLGGVTQRIARVGSRYGIDVQYPAMKYSDGQAFLAAMIAAEVSPVAVEFPQRGFVVGTPGNPVVNGAGQTGAALAIRSGAPGYTFKAGQFFDYVTSYGGVARRFVHMVSAQVTLSGGGAGTLAIWPLIRVSPNDGDALEVTTPQLEGFIQLANKRLPWTIELVRRIGVKFTVVEDR